MNDHFYLTGGNRAPPPCVDFIGIGAQKSATSWLHHVLSRHPGICASDPKELDYFTGKYDRGAAWYESHFAGCGAGTVRGECSPTYFFSADAPARAQAYNPDLKLIAILRDPVERAWSNHLHELRKGHIPGHTLFEDGLARNPAYVLQGRYKDNLTRWIAAFGEDALLVLLAEDIGAAPEAAFRSVCTHLGVDATIVPEGLRDRQHESVASHSEGLQRGLRRGGDLARRFGLGGLVRAAKSAPVLRQVLALNKKDLRQAATPMRPDTRAYLRALFQDDVDFVSDLLGRPVLNWKNWSTEDAEARDGR